MTLSPFRPRKQPVEKRLIGFPESCSMRSWCCEPNVSVAICVSRLLLRSTDRRWWSFENASCEMCAIKLPVSDSVFSCLQTMKQNCHYIRYNVKYLSLSSTVNFTFLNVFRNSIKKIDLCYSSVLMQCKWIAHVSDWYCDLPTDKISSSVEAMSTVDTNQSICSQKHTHKVNSALHPSRVNKSSTSFAGLKVKTSPLPSGR